MQADLGRRRTKQNGRVEGGGRGKEIILKVVNGRRGSSNGRVGDGSIVLRLLLVVDGLVVLRSSGLGLNLLLDIEVGSDKSSRSPSGDAGEEKRWERRSVRGEEGSCDASKGGKKNSLGKVELVDLIDGKTLGLGDEEEDEDVGSSDESSPD